MLRPYSKTNEVLEFNAERPHLESPIYYLHESMTFINLS